MSSYNKVILMGHLTRDIELRYSPTGVAVAGFGLAMNHSYVTESGEKKDSVCFADITAFGKRAETLGQYLQKGDPLLLEGRLSTETWTDKQSQQQRTKLKVVLESFAFVGGKKEGGAPAAEKPSGYRTPPGQPPAAPQRAAGTPASGSDAPPEESDDIPF